MSAYNDTIIIGFRSLIDTLDLIKHHFVQQLPIAFIVLGTIGFIGDAFTFLQPDLRSNTFCIYSVIRSTTDIVNLLVNLLPNYILTTDSILSYITDSQLCKLKLFALVFIPQLSMNLLALSLFDRYTCTCALTSPLRRIRKLKMVPWLVGITVIISGLSSLYSPLLYDVIPGYACVTTDPWLNGISYIIIHGFVTPLIMLILVYLTYRNIKHSRRRIGLVTNPVTQQARHRFIGMVITQVIVTSFLVLQWIGTYIYFVVTQYNNKSAEQWAIDLFSFSLTNMLY